MKNKLHAVLTVSLGLFFIYKGIDKIPIKLKPVSQEQIFETIIEKESYDPPVGYNLTMNTMRQSGFLRMISFFQIVAGLFMFFPKTRLLGLLFLLPMIFNIFFMHVFFDNRMDENIVTGGLLVLNLILCSFYYKRIQLILIDK